MEIKRRFNLLSLRNILILVYFVCFAVFLSFGLKPAEAANYEISAELSIPAISLKSDVTTLKLKEHGLETPDYIVGSFMRSDNKTLLIGHSSTVFARLREVEISDTVVYDDIIYTIVDKRVVEKTEIDMNSLLEGTDKETIVLMTCAGKDLPNKDSAHRLIITAEAV